MRKAEMKRFIEPQKNIRGMRRHNGDDAWDRWTGKSSR
jgi:hypothetical protein